jgi:hypothetical protein
MLKRFARQGTSRDADREIDDRAMETEQGTPGERESTRWSNLAMVALLVVGALTPMLAETKAGAAAGAVSATRDAYGYPDWYQDGTGIRVEPCLDPNEAQCILPIGTAFDAGLPLDLPDNFPDEFFYTLADSDRVSTPGCGATRPGRAFTRLAVEGAFLNGSPAPGDQMVFGRSRFSVTSGLCANTPYRFIGPYGAMMVTTNEFGGVPRNTGVDVGCNPTPITPCNFADTLNSPILQSFLRWDPAVAPAAPAGYLGDVGALHEVTGATYEANGAGNGFANYFAIEGPLVPGGPIVEIARTNLFSVSGRLAGPLLPSIASFGTTTPQLLDFGLQHTATTSPVNVVTVTNISSDPITLSAISAGATPFALVDLNTCTGRTLARDESCGIGVTFAPSAVQDYDGSLTITHNGARSPYVFPLAGTGTNPGSEAILTPTPASLTFGPTRIGVQSLAQRVRITNTGQATLRIFTSTLVDTVQSGDAAQFRITSNGCANLQIRVGRRCDIFVAIRPTTLGPINAALEMNANISNGPIQVALSGTGTGGLAAVSPTIDGATGYPTWYRDETGLRVGECIDPNDPFCVVLADDNYDPALPLVGRPSFSNFPTEFFYHVVDSDPITTPGCGSVPPGRAFVREALEAAFVNPTPFDGDQMVFGRNRVVVRGGLCPNSDYTFTHPYGQTVLQTDSTGSVKPAAGTTDIGCFPTLPFTCNFADALQSPVLGGFLRWDPAVAPAAPNGYLGDAATLHRITGSTYVAPGDSAPANYFRIVGPTTPGGPNVTIGQTTLFTVMGKINGPVVANPTSVAFDPATVGSASVPVPVTLTNEGITSVTVNALTIGGANAGDFAIDAGCAVPVVLAANGGTCTFNATFAPIATGERTAAIVVTHTGANTGMSVALDGVGAAAGNSPAISVNPASLSFVDLHTGQTSASRIVRVSNAGGQAPLVVDPPVIDNAEFELVANGCGASVDVGASCDLRVRFAPSGTGLRGGTLSFGTNVPGTPVVSVPLSGRGFAGAAAVSPGVSAEHGFADWYQDDNGIRVEPCLDPADPNCVVLADAGFDPGQPVVFPSNFPAESFYSLVDSDIVATDGCGGATAPGNALLRMALEATFNGGTPLPGDQLTFGRIRIVVTSGLCPNTSYTFTTPYGPVGPFLTNSVGAIPANAGTDDLDPLTSPVLTSGMLRWDPASAPAAPAGYLGNPAVLHAVTGSRYVAPGDTEPANYFGIDGTSMRTGLFFVSGKVAGPIVRTPGAIEFGNVDLGAVSVDQTVTLTNVGVDPVSGFVATLGGADAADFALAGGTCSGATIARDESCTVTVRFAPLATSVAGAKAATLSIAHSGTNSPATVSLAGQAVAVPLPAVSLSRTGIAFASAPVGQASAPQAVVVTNTGTADLHVSLVEIIGINPGDFSQTNTCGVAVIPGGTCTVQVTFTPSAGGNRTATLRLTDDAPNSPQTVALSGTGTAVTLSLSLTTLNFGSIGVGGSSTKTVDITNTGTGTLTISSFTITGAPQFTIAGHNCAAGVAPGRKCTVQIRFTATSIATFNATLNIASNAVGTPHAVALTGPGR